MLIASTAKVAGPSVTGMDQARHQALFDLSGRTALVTGGTRGIGRAIAETFVLAGANVVVSSRKPEAVAETEAHLRALAASASVPVDVLGVAANMGDAETPELLVASAVERFGGLDILVNNAANPIAAAVGEQTVSVWQKSFEVNLRGPALLTQAALEPLTASGQGSVVHVISVGAFLFSKGVGIYASMKAGLNALTKSHAAELGPRGIRVNALAPGTVDTDMVRNVGPGAAESMSANTIMGRPADADELASAALFLASDASSFMTGQVMVVDGGMHPH